MELLMKKALDCEAKANREVCLHSLLETRIREINDCQVLGGLTGMLSCQYYLKAPESSMLFKGHSMKTK
jgi:hypothetical protein